MSDYNSDASLATDHEGYDDDSDRDYQQSSDAGSDAGSDEEYDSDKEHWRQVAIEQQKSYERHRARRVRDGEIVPEAPTALQKGAGKGPLSKNDRPEFRRPLSPGAKGYDPEHAKYLEDRAIDIGIQWVESMYPGRQGKNNDHLKAASSNEFMEHLKAESSKEASDAGCNGEHAKASSTVWQPAGKKVPGSKAALDSGCILTKDGQRVRILDSPLSHDDENVESNSSVRRPWAAKRLPKHAPVPDSDNEASDNEDDSVDFKQRLHRLIRGESTPPPEPTQPWDGRGKFPADPLLYEPLETESSDGDENTSGTPQPSKIATRKKKHPALYNFKEDAEQLFNGWNGFGKSSVNPGDQQQLGDSADEDEGPLGPPRKRTSKGKHPKRSAISSSTRKRVRQEATEDAPVQKKQDRRSKAAALAAIIPNATMGKKGPYLAGKTAPAAARPLAKSKSSKKLPKQAPANDRDSESPEPFKFTPSADLTTGQNDMWSNAEQSGFATGSTSQGSSAAAHSARYLPAAAPDATTEAPKKWKRRFAVVGTSADDTAADNSAAVIDAGNATTTESAQPEKRTKGKTAVGNAFVDANAADNSSAVITAGNATTTEAARPEKQKKRKAPEVDNSVDDNAADNSSTVTTAGTATTTESARPEKRRKRNKNAVPALAPAIPSTSSAAATSNNADTSESAAAATSTPAVSSLAGHTAPATETFPRKRKRTQKSAPGATKKCVRCGIVKPAEDFESLVRKGAEITRCKVCQPLHCAETAARRRRLKAERLARSQANNAQNDDSDEE